MKCLKAGANKKIGSCHGIKFFTKTVPTVYITIHTICILYINAKH